MNQENLKNLVKDLSIGFLNKKIDGKLYAKITEGLIATNEQFSNKELLDFADFLAQYSPDDPEPGLYNDKDLIKKIQDLFNI